MSSYANDGDSGDRATHAQISNAQKIAAQRLAEVPDHVDEEAVGFGSSPQSSAHSAVFHLYSRVRPYRDGAPSLWFEDHIDTFHLPTERKLSVAGDTNSSKILRLQSVDGGAVQINGLQQLDKWRNRSVTYGRSHGDSIRSKVSLPVSTLHAVNDALNDALVEANLALDIPEKKVDSDPA